MSFAAKLTDAAEMDCVELAVVMRKEIERAVFAGIAPDLEKADLDHRALGVLCLHAYCRQRLRIRRHRRQHLYLQSRREFCVRGPLGTVALISDGKSR